MKLRARLLSLVLISTMIMPFMVIFASAASTAPTLTVLTDSATVTPGGEVVVTVNMANNPGIVSMRLELNYDKDVFSIASIEDVVDAGILGDTVHNNNAEKHPYVLSWQNGAAEENFTVNGDLVSVTFQVAEDAIEGESYEFSVSYDYDNADIMNFDLKPVYFDTVSASVTVGDGEPDPNAPALVIENVQGAAGDYINAILSFKNNPGVFALTVCMEYDSKALAFESAECIGAGFNMTSNDTDNIYVVECSSNEDIMGDTDFILFRFKIKDDTEPGEYVITAKTEDACNYNEIDVKFTSAKATVTVVDFLPGDVNNDGYVTIKDITRIRKYLSKSEGTVIHGGASDVNNDGYVTIKDLVRIRKHLANIPDTVLERSTHNLPSKIVVVLAT